MLRTTREHYNCWATKSETGMSERIKFGYPSEYLAAGSLRLGGDPVFRFDKRFWSAE